MRTKAFTIIELLVVIAIFAMILAIIGPAISKIKDKINGVQSPEDTMANAEIVQFEGTSVAVVVDMPYKVELKPAFNGAGISIFLSKLPENSEIIQENGKTYLYWIPTKRGDIIKTNVITSAGEMKETVEVTLIVR